MQTILKLIKVRIFEAQNSCFRYLIKLKFPVQKKVEMSFIGNHYSGYWFPNKLIESRGTIWGVGLGFDSSFEWELLKSGYTFIGFEPELNCFESSIKEFAETSAVIENYGLWDKSGEYRFTGENISIVNIFNLEEESEQKLKIRSLWDVAIEKELSSLPRPRVLKLNIEGAEREILLKLIENPIDFDLIIFQAEFLFHVGFKQIRKKFKAYKEVKNILKGLHSLGWDLIDLSRHQITFMKSELV